MNKLLFKITNSVLATRFLVKYKNDRIEFPAIIKHLQEKYGNEIFIEGFNNFDNCEITNTSDWGSARPDNLCIYEKIVLLLLARSLSSLRFH